MRKYNLIWYTVCLTLILPAISWSSQVENHDRAERHQRIQLLYQERACNFDVMRSLRPDLTTGQSLPELTHNDSTDELDLLLTIVRGQAQAIEKFTQMPTTDTSSETDASLSQQSVTLRIMEKGQFVTKTITLYEGEQHLCNQFYDYGEEKYNFEQLKAKGIIDPHKNYSDSTSPNIYHIGLRYFWIKDDPRK